MLQVDIKTYASDALEDAMRLAQTKALNSYSWSDLLNYLNYTWSDIYNRICMIDDGYYSINVRLNTKLTTLPPFVRNTVKVYSAQDVVGFNREVFRSSGMNDLESRSTYHISGLDLYCPDAEKRKVWLNYVPSPAMLFFPMNNRNPKLYEEDIEAVQETDYNLYTLVQENGTYLLRYKNLVAGVDDYNVSSIIEKDEYDLVYISCDFPYIFVTYKHKVSGRYLSGFYKDIMKYQTMTKYNPFDFTGRDSNVEYLKTTYNDKTGLGVIIRDYNDYDEREKRYRVKELGWTPDSVIVYPGPESYRYLVARLASKLAAFNESEVMGVSAELVEAKYAFEAFCERDKSAWKRIDNVNGPTMGDWL